MAEAALFGVAKSVLGQLTSPALQEALLVWNFDEDLNRLHHTIQTITDFLHDAEQRESKESLVKEQREKLVKGWLSRLRAVLFDAGDLLDDVAYRALSKKSMSDHPTRGKVNRFFSKSNHLAFMLKTAHDIKDIRERLNDIKEDMLPFQFQCLQIEERTLDRKEAHSFVDVKTVIGRDEEKEQIINLLLSEQTTCQKNLSVISVIGFGGLGKTTLAQLVYNDDRVQTGFDLCLWTCINYLSDLKSVLVAILTSALKYTPQHLGLDQLQEKLRESIKEKKFLLVLDDVWDDEPSNWGKLEELLVCGKSGSKVLATTRNTKVAQSLDAIEPYYRLNVLSEESALNLFVKMAYKDGEYSTDSELLPLVQQIVRKCGYVPLALITIGRMLRSKKKEKKVLSSIVDKELPEALLDDNGNDKVMQVLKVSYNNLSSALKHCFAYCSLFPKDYRFDKDELVRMWIAHGFIEPDGKKSLEEIGDQCFFDLVNRCFFQEVEEKVEDGYSRYTCKMHDLLHDLAIRVAGTESRCFIEEDLEGLVALRHISFTCDPNFLFENSVLSSHSKKLRSTLLFRSAGKFKTCSLNSLLECFNTLRVLRLPGLDVAMLPDSFGGLIHLRYLDLSNSYTLEKIPNSICKLHHLQTLNLKSCSSLVELPSKIGKLVSLRHLFLEGCRKLDSLPSGLAEITTLVTLDRVIVHHRDGELRYLGRLDDLCGVVKIQLPVKGWSNYIEDTTNSNMFNKKKLKGMIISSARGEHELTKEEAEAVVEALRPHENLEYLNIEGYVGDKLPSWVFSLSNLKQLILKYCPNLEYLDHGKVKFESVFPCLELLDMDSLPNLKGWWREAVAPEENACMSLSRVSKVLITFCPKLVGSVPSIGGSIEDLRLCYVDGKLLSKLFSRPNQGCSSNCHPYSKLKIIYLSCVKDLNCLPENLMKCFSALKSLQILYFEELCQTPPLRWVSKRGLAHLTALEELMIWDCRNVKLEDEEDDEEKEENNNGLNGMPWRALQRLRVLNVPWQRHLQGGLQYLTALQVLHIDYDGSEQADVEDRWVSVCGLAHLTALEELWISGCRIVKLEDANEEIQVGMPWRYLQRLRKLKVPWHRHLQGGLQYLTVLEELEISPSCGSVKLEDANEEIQVGMPCRYLQRLRKLKVSWHRHLQGVLQYLTVLKELEIVYYESGQVEADNEDVQVRGALWTRLDNLQKLEINYEGISRQKEHSRVEVPKWIQYLPSVKDLNFCRCKELSMRWTILANMKLLREVTFLFVEKVVNVNVDEMVTEQQTISNSLLRLTISFSENASWINDFPSKLFPSLRTLQLRNMENLGRIPDGIQHLTSLQQLTILHCPSEVGKRCEPERGEDWRLISHIPTIYICWKDNGGKFQHIHIRPRGRAMDISPIEYI